MIFRSVTLQSLICSRRGAALLAAAGLVLPLLAACASEQPIGGSAAAASGAGSITVYSGQHEQTVKQLADDFTRRTGVQVALRSGNEAELANQILQEGKASPADVFYAGNPPPLEAVRAAGLLSEVQPDTLAAVPSRYVSPTRNWVGVSARSGALVYNTDQLTLAELPTTLKALAGPAWKGRFGFAPTETDFSPIVTAFAKVEGDAGAAAFLKGLKANAKAYEDNEAVVAAVNRGEVATGLVEHYYWYRLREEVGDTETHSALTYFAPGDPGGLLAVSGAGVLTASRHVADAQRFLAYLVSPPAQALIGTSDSFEYPLATGASTSRPLRPFGELRPPQLAPVDLGDGKQALALLQAANLL